MALLQHKFIVNYEEQQGWYKNTVQDDRIDRL